MQHWKNEIWKSEKHLNCTKLKFKWNFAIVEMQMKCCKIWKCKWNVSNNLKWNCIWNSLIFAQRESFWLQWKRFCISKEIPREWMVGESKKTYKLQFSIKLFQLQSFPDAIWWKNNCLTISISVSCGLGNVNTPPTHTPSMVLGTYATISLWSISTTCTGYPCRNKVIPFETTICSKR